MKMKFKGGVTLFLVLLVHSVFAQQKNISGIVSDEVGPMLGVNVMVKGTNMGIDTDITGRYSIKAKSGETLVFSYVGYKTVEKVVGLSNKINVVLSQGSNKLKTVVVVGYKRVDKNSYTGAASTVKGKNLVNTSGGVAGALQGKTAGVQVVGDQIRVRGTGTFSASSDPLIVVDGVAGAPRPIDEDVASISVLKDASATALYGSRGANGVIVYTLKRGKKGSAKINIKSQFTINERILPDWERMNTSQFYKHQFLGFVNKYYDGNAGSFDTVYEKFNGELKSNPYNLVRPFNLDGSLKDNAKLLYSTDWEDVLLRASTKSEWYVSASGGSSNANYRVSTQLYSSDKFVRTTGSSGFSTDISVNTKIAKKLDFGMRSRIGFAKSHGGSGGQGVSTTAVTYAPSVPVYLLRKNVNTDGTYTYSNVYNSIGEREYNWQNPNSPDYNPLALLHMDEKSSKGFSAYLAPKVTFTPFKNFSLSSLYARTLRFNSASTFLNKEHGDGPSENGVSYRDDRNSDEYLWQNLLRYNFKIANSNNFSMLLGSEVEEYVRKSFYAKKSGYPLGRDVSTELTTGEIPKKTLSSTIETARVSYFGNIDYSFNDRYFLSGSYRTDGSSKFGPDKRWGDFWSIGASWRLSKESFFNVSFVDNLKLRASYGVTGNDGIGNYKFGDYYSMGANYGGKLGLLHTQLPNTQLSWEQNESLSVGVDFSLFKRVLTGSFGWYKRQSNGLLYDNPIPTTSGFSSVLMNIGDMSNRGLELELSYKVFSNKDFGWISSLTMSTDKSEILSLPTNDILKGTKMWSVGGGLFDYHLREWAGVDPENGDALWYKDITDASGKIIDKVKTNKSSEATLYSDLGQSNPKMFLGFSNQFRYKGLDFSFDFIGAFGHKIYDGTYRSAMHDGASNSKHNNLSVDALNAWTPNNRSTNVPKYIIDNSSNSNIQSTRWLVDGDFVKLRNVAIGYNILPSVFGVIKLDSFRVFGTADNVFSVSDYKSGDPETGFSGISSGNAFTGVRTFRFGVDIKF